MPISELQVLVQEPQPVIDARGRPQHRLTYLVGSVCFVFWLSCGFAGALRLNHHVAQEAEWPLGVLHSIAVSDAHIFCGSGFYGRIQQYDHNGKFVTGWNVPGSGAFEFALDVEGNLEALVVRQEKVYRFSPDGRLLGSRPMPHHEYSAFRRAGPSAPSVEDDVQYEIRHGSLYPSVIRIGPRGSRTTIVQQPFYLWVVNAPFPSIAFVFIATALVAIGLKSGKRRSGTLGSDGQHMKYHNTDTQIHVGDYIKYRSIFTLFIWKTGRASYVPGQSQPHPEFTQLSGCDHLALTLDNGSTVSWLYVPGDFRTSRNLKFIRRRDDDYRGITPDIVIEPEDRG